MKAGEHFRCTKLRCSLSRKSCGKRFLRAEEVEFRMRKEEGVPADRMVYMPCRGCEVGEVHSTLVQLVPMDKLKRIHFGRARNRIAT